MPAPLPNVDWDALRDLYFAGMSFKAIAQQAGVKPGALRAHASRHGWKDSVTEAVTVVQRAVTATLAERGKQWSHRIAKVLEMHLDRVEKLQPEECDLDELEQLVRIIKSLDDVGRRTFRLDEVAGNDCPWGGRVIDVVSARTLVRQPALEPSPTEPANAVSSSQPG
jgi:hypothetical protein